ncbi:ABC transporter permease [Roseateles sp.]|uniref:ABC transporter permease n=1 Tax=Roseateles sp. TaxID=1971397 RepID=UPI0039EC3D8E
MNPAALLRPYGAAFRARWLAMLQYRSAALAGFVTQCWWGGIKVMVLAAFYAGAPHAGAMPLSQAISYTWTAQGLLTLLPWAGDPEVAQAVRSGAVAYDRLRPLDTYALWYARSAGWLAARVLPRLALMAGFAALLLPLCGASPWAWQAPATAGAALAFLLSALLAWALATAMVMLLNIATLAALDARGINALATPVVIVLSGNLLPLALLPDGWQAALLLQPLAGLLDIPLRLYFGQVGTWALGLQLGWLVLLVVLGRLLLAHSFRALDVQGG